MTTLAGSKIRRHRYARKPRMTRQAFGEQYGPVASTTVQGWEDEGKRPSQQAIVNRIAAAGIATHADWFAPATCPRCEREAESADAAACGRAGCPLAQKSAA